MTQQLGARIALLITHQLVDEGLPAVYAGPVGSEQPMATPDVALHGYFVSADAGNGTTGATGANGATGAKHMLVGFSAAHTQLTTALEAFQMTPQGLSLMGAGTVADNGGPAAEVLLPAGVMAATAQPVGLAANGTVQLISETSGSLPLDAAAGPTADRLSDQVIGAARRLGWVGWRGWRYWL